jgi:hypothetical protein
MHDTMFHAEVEPMQNNLDRVPRTGLWKVVIYEGDRFVRTDRDNMIISVGAGLRFCDEELCAHLETHSLSDRNVLDGRSIPIQLHRQVQEVGLPWQNESEEGGN